MIEAWVAKGKYSKLLDIWVKGLIFDWSKLYGDSKPHRISLPTYPFAREWYWIEQKEVRNQTTAVRGQQSEACQVYQANGMAEGMVSKRLHPLVHENTSTLEEQRFSSTFTGEEFFLKDHQVKGEKILPGVAYLEMVREAVEQATGALSEDKKTIKRLSLKMWYGPIRLLWE